MRVLIAAVICSAAISGLSAWWMRGQIADGDIAQLHADALKAQNAAQAQILERERANHAQLAKAAQNAHKRAQVANADAAAARDELDRLRLDLAAARVDEPTTAATADLRADLFADLLGQCAARYLDMAQKADRADQSARTLMEAWPK